MDILHVIKEEHSYATNHATGERSVSEQYLLENPLPVDVFLSAKSEHQALSIFEKENMSDREKNKEVTLSAVEETNKVQTSVGPDRSDQALNDLQNENILDALKSTTESHESSVTVSEADKLDQELTVNNKTTIVCKDNKCHMVFAEVPRTDSEIEKAILNSDLISSETSDQLKNVLSKTVVSGAKQVHTIRENKKETAELANSNKITDKTRISNNKKVDCVGSVESTNKNATLKQNEKREAEVCGSISNQIKTTSRETRYRGLHVPRAMLNQFNPEMIRKNASMISVYRIIYKNGKPSYKKFVYKGLTKEQVGFGRNKMREIRHNIRQGETTSQREYFRMVPLNDLSQLNDLSKTAEGLKNKSAASNSLEKELNNVEQVNAEELSKSAVENVPQNEENNCEDAQKIKEMLDKVKSAEVPVITGKKSQSMHNVIHTTANSKAVESSLLENNKRTPTPSNEANTRGYNSSDETTALQNSEVDCITIKDSQEPEATSKIQCEIDKCRKKPPNVVTYLDRNLPQTKNKKITPVFIVDEFNDEFAIGCRNKPVSEPQSNQIIDSQNGRCLRSKKSETKDVKGVENIENVKKINFRKMNSNTVEFEDTIPDTSEEPPRLMLNSAWNLPTEEHLEESHAKLIKLNKSAVENIPQNEENNCEDAQKIKEMLDKVKSAEVPVITGKESQSAHNVIHTTANFKAVESSLLENNKRTPKPSNEANTRGYNSSDKTTAVQNSEIDCTTIEDSQEPQATSEMQCEIDNCRKKPSNGVSYVRGISKKKVTLLDIVDEFIKGCKNKPVSEPHSYRECADTNSDSDEDAPLLRLDFAWDLTKLKEMGVENLPQDEENNFEEVQMIEEMLDDGKSVVQAISGKESQSTHNGNVIIDSQSVKENLNEYCVENTCNFMSDNKVNLESKRKNIKIVNGKVCASKAEKSALESSVQEPSTESAQNHILKTMDCEISSEKQQKVLDIEDAQREHDSNSPLINFKEMKQALIQIKKLSSMDIAPYPHAAKLLAEVINEQSKNNSEENKSSMSSTSENRVTGRQNLRCLHTRKEEKKDGRSVGTIKNSKKTSFRKKNSSTVESDLHGNENARKGRDDILRECNVSSEESCKTILDTSEEPENVIKCPELTNLSFNLTKLNKSAVENIPQNEENNCEEVQMIKEMLDEVKSVVQAKSGKESQSAHYGNVIIDSQSVKENLNEYCAENTCNFMSDNKVNLESKRKNIKIVNGKVCTSKAEKSALESSVQEPSMESAQNHILKTMDCEISSEKQQKVLDIEDAQREHDSNSPLINFKEMKQARIQIKKLSSMDIAPYPHAAKLLAEVINEQSKNNSEENKSSMSSTSENRVTGRQNLRCLHTRKEEKKDGRSVGTIKNSKKTSFRKKNSSTVESDLHGNENTRKGRDDILRECNVSSEESCKTIPDTSEEPENVIKCPELTLNLSFNLTKLNKSAVENVPQNEENNCEEVQMIKEMLDEVKSVVQAISGKESQSAHNGNVIIDSQSVKENLNEYCAENTCNFMSDNKVNLESKRKNIKIVNGKVCASQAEKSALESSVQEASTESTQDHMLKTMDCEISSEKQQKVHDIEDAQREHNSNSLSINFKERKQARIQIKKLSDMDIAPYPHAAKLLVEVINDKPKNDTEENKSSMSCTSENRVTGRQNLRCLHTRKEEKKDRRSVGTIKNSKKTSFRKKNSSTVESDLNSNENTRKGRDDILLECNVSSEESCKTIPDTSEEPEIITKYPEEPSSKANNLLSEEYLEESPSKSTHLLTKDQKTFIDSLTPERIKSLLNKSKDVKRVNDSKVKESKTSTEQEVKKSKKCNKIIPSFVQSQTTASKKRTLSVDENKSDVKNITYSEGRSLLGKKRSISLSDTKTKQSAINNNNKKLKTLTSVDSAEHVQENKASNATSKVPVKPKKHWKDTRQLAFLAAEPALFSQPDLMVKVDNSKNKRIKTKTDVTNVNVHGSTKSQEKSKCLKKCADIESKSSKDYMNMENVNKTVLVGQTNAEKKSHHVSHKLDFAKDNFTFDKDESDSQRTNASKDSTPQSVNVNINSPSLSCKKAEKENVELKTMHYDDNQQKSVGKERNCESQIIDSVSTSRNELLCSTDDAEIGTEIVKESASFNAAPAVSSSSNLELNVESNIETISLSQSNADEENRLQSRKSVRLLQKRSQTPAKKESENSPKDDSNKKRHKRRKSDTEDDPDKLWCICRKPHNNRFMIQCDNCKEWYHGSCVGINRNLGLRLEKEKREWKCPICNQKIAALEEINCNKSEPVTSENKNGNVRLTELSSEDAIPDPDLLSTPPWKSQSVSKMCDSVSQCIPGKDTESASSSVKKSTKEEESQAVSHSCKNIVRTPKTPSDINRTNPDKCETKTNSKSQLAGAVTTVEKVAKAANQKEENSMDQSSSTKGDKVSKHKSTKKSSKRCIACYNRTLPDSCYCSDECIENHAAYATEAVGTAKGLKGFELDNYKFVVYDRIKGTVIAGDKGPAVKDAVKWLKAHKNYVIAFKSSSSKPRRESVAPKKEVESVDSKKCSPRQVEPYVRSNVRKSLKEILSKRCANSDDFKKSDEFIHKVAMQIESELYSAFKDDQQKYSKKYRTLMFNIKDPRNQGLFRKVLEEIAPGDLVRMSHEELASQELAQWRENEAQHSLDIIKRVNLEQQQIGNSCVLKKTHKGEVEIEENLTSIDEDVPVVEGKVNQDESTKSESPEKPKAEDTTQDHRSHLFSQNCRICLGIQPEHKSTVDKGTPKKVRVAHTINVDLSSPLTLDLASESFEKPSSKRVAAKSNIEKDQEPPTATVSIKSPETHEMIKKSKVCSVWKGFLCMPDVAKFLTTAYKVSGNTIHLQEDIPDVLQMCGRIQPDQVWEYLSKVKQAGSKELVVIQFKPANEEELATYNHFYKYLSSKKRYGVAKGYSKRIKDFYILPLAATSPAPIVLMPFDGPGLPSDRPHLLLGVIVKYKEHKAKGASSSKRKSSAPKSDFSKQVECYSPPPASRSYTPPLPSSNQGRTIEDQADECPFGSEMSNNKLTISTYEPSYTPPLKQLTSKLSDDEKPYDPEQDILNLDSEKHETVATLDELDKSDNSDNSEDLKKINSLKRDCNEILENISSLKKLAETKSDAEGLSPAVEALDINSVAQSEMTSFLNLSANFPDLISDILRPLNEGTNEAQDVDMRISNLFNGNNIFDTTFESSSKETPEMIRTDKSVFGEKCSSRGATPPPDYDEAASVDQSSDPRIKLRTCFDDGNFSSESTNVSLSHMSASDLVECAQKQLSETNDAVFGLYNDEIFDSSQNQVLSDDSEDLLFPESDYLINNWNSLEPPPPGLETQNFCLKENENVDRFTHTQISENTVQSNSLAELTLSNMPPPLPSSNNSVQSNYLADLTPDLTGSDVPPPLPSSYHTYLPPGFSVQTPPPNYKNFPPPVVSSSFPPPPPPPPPMLMSPVPEQSNSQFVEEPWSSWQVSGPPNSNPAWYNQVNCNDFWEHSSEGCYSGNNSQCFPPERSEQHANEHSYNAQNSCDNDWNMPPPRMNRGNWQKYPTRGNRWENQRRGRREFPYRKNFMK